MSDDDISEREEFVEAVKEAIGAAYRWVTDRPDWQRGLIGVTSSLVLVLIGDEIQAVFDFAISLVPALGQFIPQGSFLASNRAILVVIGITFGYQVHRLNTLEQKIENMTRVETDGGARPPNPQNDPLDNSDDDTSGGGAIGGAIAGAALGSSLGPGGTLGGAVLGAILGDSIEKSADKSDDAQDNDLPKGLRDEIKEDGLPGDLREKLEEDDEKPPFK